MSFSLVALTVSATLVGAGIFYFSLQPSGGISVVLALVRASGIQAYSFFAATIVLGLFFTPRPGGGMRREALALHHLLTASTLVATATWGCAGGNPPCRPRLAAEVSLDWTVDEKHWRSTLHCTHFETSGSNLRDI